MKNVKELNAEQLNDVNGGFIAGPRRQKFETVVFLLPGFT